MAKYYLNFAPHLGPADPNGGMFVHHAGTDPVDQIRFMHDHGFEP